MGKYWNASIVSSHVLYTQRKNFLIPTKGQWNVCWTIFSTYVEQFSMTSLLMITIKTRTLELSHCRENVTCESPMEIPYYSSKLFKNVCFYCGRERSLMPSNVEFYPQCISCQSKTRANVAKRKQVVASDLVKKKQKNISLRYNSIHVQFDSSTSFVNIFALLEKPMFLVLCK